MPVSIWKWSASIVAASGLALAFSHCKPVHGPDESDTLAKAPPAAGSTGPVPSTDLAYVDAAKTHQSISPGGKAKILQAWRLVRDTYYKNKAYDAIAVYSPTPGISTNPADIQRGAPDASEAHPQCTNACPSYYSSLVCHYYCWHPSYARVIPNVRGCVSNIARGAVSHSSGRTMFYPEIYDYCVYQPYDAVKGANKPFPKYDQNEIDKNWAADNRVGVLSWVDANEGDAFRYVMFTHHNPEAFSLADQQEIINSFYGVKLQNPSYTVKDKADVQACQKSKRQALSIEPQDGTHCSNKWAAGTYSYAPHLHFAAISKFVNEYQKDWPNLETSPGKTVKPIPTIARPSGPPMHPVILTEADYTTKSKNNSGCVMTVKKIAAKGKVMDQFSMSFKSGCVVNGATLARGKTFHATDCGTDNECDYDGIPIPQNSLIEVKSPNKFTIKYGANWGGPETWTTP